jgi:TRAP transporter 4TM/12TM fusion protein
MRKLTGFWNVIIIILSISLVVFHLYTAAFGVFPALIQRSIHLGLVMIMTFLIAPPKKQNREENKPPFYDIFLSVLTAASIVYLLSNYRALILNPFRWLGPLDVFFAVVTTLMIFEISRRAVGLIFTGLALVFFIYALFGPYFPGIWGHRTFSFDLIFQTLYHSTDGIWGQMIGVSAGMLAMFSLFGSMLCASGGVELFVSLGQKIAGRTVGSQGKAALVASGLFGMISGSAMANAAGTGALTIPLMKRAGYSSEWAAAISAVGSTGGTIMPPMMGSGAFIMAQILGISYLQIVKASFLPAFLYYVGAFVAVHYISRKSALNDFPVEGRVSISEITVILAPILLFLFFLFGGFTAALSAFHAAAGGFCISLFVLLRNAKTPKAGLAAAWKQFNSISISGAKNIVNVASMLAGSQIIITLISLTGFGAKISDLIIGAGQVQIVFCLFIAMLICIVFGMALPAAASYVLASAIFVPSLAKLGIDTFTAHLFIFYFAGFSTITPPVCSAVSLSAKLARANWLKTGFLSCLIALPAFIIPYTFVYDRALLFGGSIINVGIALLIDFAGVYAVGVGVAGCFVKPLSIPYRCAFILAGILFVIPHPLLRFMGLVILVVCCVSNITPVKDCG